MIKIKTNDGAIFTGQTYVDIVNQLRLDTRVQPDLNNALYMEGAARRITVWNGMIISYKNEKEFIHECQRAGVIAILESEENPHEQNPIF